MNTLCAEIAQHAVCQDAIGSFNRCLQFNNEALAVVMGQLVVDHREFEIAPF